MKILPQDFIDNEGKLDVFFNEMETEIREQTEHINTTQALTKPTDGGSKGIQTHPVKNDVSIYYWGFWLAIDYPIIHNNGNKFTFHSTINKEAVEELKEKMSTKMTDIISNYINVGITDMKDMPVYLTIDSGGGSIPDGFDLIDFIKTYPLPVYTIGTGTVASMAVPLLLAGKKRFVTENAHLLIHQFRAGVQGKRQDILDMLQHLESVHTQLIDYISSHSKLTKADVTEMMKSETWFTSQDAIKYGVADEIL